MISTASPSAAQPSRSTSLTVGVAGGTGAGKSLLVRQLAARLGKVCVLDLDSYYLDRRCTAAEDGESLNFDEPSAFDIDLYLDHLQRLRRGEIVAKPCYSFEDHARYGTQPVYPSALILVEGIFALWWDELRRELDLKVFVDAPADLRLARRLQRDMLERGRSTESVLIQYMGTVRLMHLRYVEATRSHADLVVINDGDIDTCVATVCSSLQDIWGSL